MQPQFRASCLDIFIWKLKEQILAKYFRVNFVLSEVWGWWSGFKPGSLPLRITIATPTQERRESLRSPRYLELYIVGDHTLVRGAPGGLESLVGVSSACRHSTAVSLPL